MTNISTYRGIPYMSIYYIVMSDDTQRRTYHSGKTERHSPIRGESNSALRTDGCWRSLVMFTDEYQYCNRRRKSRE